MQSNTTARRPLMWKLPLTAGVITLAVFAALSLCRPDTSLILALLIIAILVVSGIASLLYAALRRKDQFEITAVTLAVVWAVVLPIVVLNHKYPFELRDAARWLISSREYKREVLSQQTPVGDLKHIEWDGSGFAGVANNTVYLVFDPTDVSHASGNKPGFNGCGVWQVQRLEAHWYAVLFYTDQDWDDCTK